MKTIFNIILALFFFQQLFFGEGWYAVFCRFLAVGGVVYVLASVYIAIKQEAAKPGAGQPAGNQKAAQENAASARNSEVHAEQEDVRYPDSEVHMMDGPYGRAPFGGVIWDKEYTIDEIIFKDGVYYYNQHSEEWEEDDEEA
ncbi:MAG: hypothetical protein ACI3XH_00440 [Phascolarctobacterium sp.]